MLLFFSPLRSYPAPLHPGRCWSCLMGKPNSHQVCFQDLREHSDPGEKKFQFCFWGGLLRTYNVRDSSSLFNFPTTVQRLQCQSAYGPECGRDRWGHFTTEIFLRWRSQVQRGPVCCHGNPQKHHRSVQSNQAKAEQRWCRGTLDFSDSDSSVKNSPN